jgi:hypothetical protein
VILKKLCPTVALVFLLVGLAHADSIDYFIPAPRADVSVSGEYGSALGSHLFYVRVSAGQTSINQPFSISNGTKVDVYVDAAVRAGEMRVYNSISSTNMLGQPFIRLQTNAQYIDNVTISFAPLAGQVGYILPIFALTGRTLCWPSCLFPDGGPNDAHANVSVYWQDSVNDGIFHVTDRRNLIGDATLAFDPIPFHWGAPFALGANLSVDNTLTVNGSAHADFGRLTLIGLQAFDQDMNPILDPKYDSALGANYSRNGIVPEPPTTVLIGLGLGAIGVLRRVKRTVG